MPIRKLTELSALASAALPPAEALERALPLLRESLDAEDVFLVYGDERGFRCFGTSELQLSDIALWLINRDLTSRRAACAFDNNNGRVVDFRPGG